MSDLTDDNPPYHIISDDGGQPLGPFSSYLDASLARTIAEPQWRTATILNRDEYAAHMTRTVLLKGPFTDEELRSIVELMQHIEGLRPDDTFSIVMEDPDADTGRLAQVASQINPPRPGYERAEFYQRFDDKG